MTRYELVFLLLVLFSWGRATGSQSAAVSAQKPAAPTTTTPEATASNRSQQTDASSVAPDTPVITITGLCDNPPADKTSASNCQTVITRAQFEKVIAAVQPNMTARAQREFAERYANALVMARKAEQMGLDKGANYEEQMRVARIQVLFQELNKAIQTEASQISDMDIGNYYHSNLASFEQVEMERIHVPKAQDLPAPTDNTLKDVDEKRQLERTEPFMKEVADKLHARAIAGEDFSKLQTEAYNIAGLKAAASSSLGKIRRISLPQSHAWVMDLEPGGVSSVIVDPNGYFIYKMKSKETMPLDQAREEIKTILRSQRIHDETRVIQESATPTLNEAYFRPQRTPR